MHETPVGMKCPACARVEIRNPRDRRRYAAGAAGLILAGLLTAGAVLLFSRLNLLVAILLGVAIGAAVRKAGGEQPRLGGTAALSAICGMALGVLVLGAPYPILFSPAFWIPGAIAAGSAGLVASR